MTTRITHKDFYTLTTFLTNNRGRCDGKPFSHIGTLVRANFRFSIADSTLKDALEVAQVNYAKDKQYATNPTARQQQMARGLVELCNEIGFEPSNFDNLLSIAKMKREVKNV